MNKSERNNRALSLIEQYFDGTTSLDEERQLRRLLADPTVQAPEADEARAVLGFAAFRPNTPAKTGIAPRRVWIAAASIAASLAVVVTIGFATLRSAPPQSEITAYIGGSEITDARVVMELVDRDLSIFALSDADASTSIDAELSAIGDMLN